LSYRGLYNNKIIKTNGLFIFIGHHPVTDFAKNLNITDEKGYIFVDQNMRTKVANVYACGDVIKKELYQIVTGAGEAAIAATSCVNDLA